MAAGLIWGLISGDMAFKLFFPGCVPVAGLCAGITVKRSILVVQALPALIALVKMLMSR